MVLEESPACARAQKRAQERAESLGKTTSGDVFLFVSALISYKGLKGFFQ